MDHTYHSPFHAMLLIHSVLSATFNPVAHVFCSDDVE
jgi:hypothetical protein